MIFGLVGLMASGKGAAAKYLAQKHGAEVFRFSSVLRDILDRLHMEQSREHITRISEVLRAEFGEDVLSKTFVYDIQASSSQCIVVDGIRRMPELTHLSSLPGFVLVDIAADPRVRYERLVARGENIGDSSKTFEVFMADHLKLSTEATIPEVQAQATERVDNNGTEEELYAQLDTLVEKYR